jgi:hypothetical protein
VPSVEDDVVLKNRIANNAGLPDVVPLRWAYSGGSAVRYWDFGAAASGSLEPMWTFRRRQSGGELAPIDHPDLIDSLPGDNGYSPLREILTVVVTDAYAGERITSFAALEDAIDLGLVEEPVRSKRYVDRPVVPADALLASPHGAEPIEPEPVYCRGRVASFFRIQGPVERVFEIGMGRLSMPKAYALRRWHQTVELDEAAFGADLDGDGDQDDSNLVLAADAASPAYAPLWSKVEVTVSDEYEFGDSRAESDLFETIESETEGQRAGPPQARAETVLDWAASDELLHMVLVEVGDGE